MPDPHVPAAATPAYPDLPPREEMPTGAGTARDQQAQQQQ